MFFFTLLKPIILKMDGIRGKQQVIDAGNLQKGVYLLYLNSNNKQLIQKIIK